MPFGPGEYDDEVTTVRAHTKAQGVLLVVFDGTTTTVHGGNYYGIRSGSSRLEPIAPADLPRSPDVVICRRVADYPGGRPPAAAEVRPCARCQAPVAFNPAGPHQDRPRICMQCAAIRPLPIDPPS